MTTPIEQATKDFYASLQCPIEFAPLSTAVTIEHCGYTLNQDAAIKLRSGHKLCPTCKNHPVGYINPRNHILGSVHPDDMIREIVRLALPIDREDFDENTQLSAATIKQIKAIFNNPSFFEELPGIGYPPPWALSATYSGKRSLPHPIPCLYAQ